ncbi:SusC/RagA family TonB-linked outer membrane protein [Mucilaginibacter sp. HMF5004]|uniref:SusC/RagA family TonB-linked outer membrane protein n=1 Tax=Mucilaginibacter rivuli TaxID=2857527 RepID=UPI001C5F5646|nr:SusC/RagA family TonB-linked outer membrane protein [Mucilaginibacter rivuli]MBW4888531.1 SusC/RagA family TonB-linked outer membrane protein [Mucilaginibacter rivuli]
MKITLLRITYFLLMLSTCLPLMLSAQAPAKVIVRGKVIDAKDKLGIPGASVVELDKDKRVITGILTDLDGNFALRVSDVHNQIQVSFISYKTFSEPINGRTVINVSLTSTSKTLAGVEITGVATPNTGNGLNIDKRDLTTSTATINAKDLAELSATSIDQALQGRLPGVDIGTTSGDPGAPMSIRIRGTSAINGSSNPLIVLDGLPYDINIPSDFSFQSADEQGYAQLLNIAPSDIKDITVLKDAASTAIWGARAANGVLVITTKRGAIGKPIFNYNFRGTIQNQPKPLPLLNGDQYSELIPEEIANRGGLPINILNFPEFNYDKRDPFNYYNYSNNTDWIGAITQTGYIQNHNISMQGGGDKARYFASVGYINQRGTTLGTALSNITSRINLDYTVSNRISFLTDIAYTHVDNNLNYTTALRSMAYNKMPNMSIYQYDEYGNQTPVFFSPASNIQGQYPSTANPVALAKAAVATQTGERITPRFNLRYSILPSVLQTTFDIRFDINNVKSKSFLPQIATGRPSTEAVVNRAADVDGDSYAIDSKFNLIYTPRFKSDKHTLQTLLSFQTSDAKTLSQNITTANSASSNLQDAADAARIQSGDFVLSTTNVQTRSIGLVLSNQYSLLDRYIINVGARLDGNSLIGSTNRYRISPSISSRWRVSGEPFMAKVKAINDLSLRFSFGATPQAPDPKYAYGYYNTYSPTTSSYAGQSGIQASNIGLDNLKYQTLYGTDLGLNFWAFKNRVMIDVDYYNNKTNDLLFNGLNIPAYTGFTTLNANVGTLVNRGLEIGITTIIVKTKKLQVNFDFNIAKNENVMESISDQYPSSDGKRVDQNGVYRTFLQVGNPFGSFYGFRYKGVYKDQQATIATGISGNPIITPSGQTVYMRFNYPQTDYVFQAGDAKYEDINHDGNINADDIVYLGNGTPKVTGGFGPTVTINGNLKINAFFVYKLGYQLINQNLITTTNMYGYNNQSTAVLRRWRNPGDITDMPRALQGTGYNWLGSDRYVSDASFCRLQSVTVRYSLAKQLLDKLQLKSASIYVTAENLFTITNYLGVEPDVSTRGLNTPFSYASDASLTPASKNFSLGLTVGF